MAGGDQRQRLVAHLRVGHAGPVALDVAGGEQDREQVAVLLASGGAALGDDARRRALELVDALLEAPHAGERRPQQHRQERDREVVEELADLGHGAPDPLGVGVELGAEEGPGDDAERELGHVGGHVAGLALPPRVSDPNGLLGHDAGVGGDPPAVERRLHHPPLPQVEVALARQEPVPEHDPGALESRPLLERALVRDEHLAREVGPHDDEDVLRPDPEVHEVAVAARAGRS